MVGYIFFSLDLIDPCVVSVTGGRQVDGAIAALDALERICASEKVRKAQRSGTFHVLFDSGIRTGSDIIKALALGAQAVLCECLAVDSISRSLTRKNRGSVGRPYMYGLTVAGEDGVVEQVRNILAEFEVTMGLCGIKSIDEIRGNRTMLMRRLHSNDCSETAA